VSSEQRSSAASAGMAQVVDRNIEALLARRRAEERALGWQERVAAAISRFAGSMAFVYVHLVVYGLWVAINLPWSPDALRFDPTFVVLAMAASVEAIFLSTFILITQNRMMAESDKRADLSLQVSLLAEHEVTRLIALVKQIGQRLGVEGAQEPELDELSRDVHPEQVLERMDEHERKEPDAAR
jgi:uncharacterized membrane protein